MKEETILKVVSEEIKEILKKHNLAASVVLHSEGGFAEHFNYMNTTYSCAYITSDNEVRLYAKRKDFKSDEEWEDKVTKTANMINMLGGGSGRNFLFMETMEKKLGEKVEITHTDRT